jgi:hypothetical protein
MIVPFREKHKTKSSCDSSIQILDVTISTRIQTRYGTGGNELRGVFAD